MPSGTPTLTTVCFCGSWEDDSHLRSAGPLFMSTEYLLNWTSLNCSARMTGARVWCLPLTRFLSGFTPGLRAIDVCDLNVVDQCSVSGQSADHCLHQAVRLVSCSMFSSGHLIKACVRYSSVHICYSADQCLYDNQLIIVYMRVSGDGWRRPTWINGCVFLPLPWPRAIRLPQRAARHTSHTWPTPVSLLGCSKKKGEDMFPDFLTLENF